jgi:hypothetical protein
MLALVNIAPSKKLPDAGFEHLIGVEACVFAQHRKGSDSHRRNGVAPALMQFAASHPQDVIYYIVLLASDDDTI